MYTWKGLAELGWAAAVAAAVFLLITLAEFEPGTVVNWQTWAISLASGCLRAAAGAILAKIGRKQGGGS